MEDITVYIFKALISYKMEGMMKDTSDHSQKKTCRDDKDHERTSGMLSLSFFSHSLSQHNFLRLVLITVSNDVKILC
jgi:hypothetical protein